MEFPSMLQSHIASLMLDNTFEGQPSRPMQPLKSTTKSSCNFTKSQIALALVIQKSKPEGLSTSEYCRQLKTHVKTNKPLSSKCERYVDTAEFWKDQYAKLHRDTRDLEDKVRYLDMQQRVQKGSISYDSTSSQVHPGVNVGEIRVGSDNVSQAHLPLWRKQEVRETVDRAMLPGYEYEVYLHSLIDDTRLRLSGYAIRIGRQRTNLEEMLPVANNLIDIEQLVQFSCDTIRLLDAMLSHCCVPHWHLHWNQDGGGIQAALQEVINQAGLAFLSCFKALTDLCRTILGRGKRDSLVYRMVMIFHRSLNLLCNVECVEDGREESVSSEPGYCDQQPFLVNSEYAVSKYLAEMLASVAYALDWKVHQHGHCELLEGILFSVLERTGHLVSKAIFSEHVASSRNPGNITGSGSGLASSWILNSEARYILRILHATLGGPDRREFVVQVLAASKVTTEFPAISETSIESSVRRQDLVSGVRTKIRNTLFKSCVGGSELETMILPVAPPCWPSVPTKDEIEQEKYGPDWLIETVWALIGWDSVVTF